MKVVSNLNLNSQAKGVNLPDPSANQDYATKASTDAIKTGLSAPVTVQIFTTTGAGTWTKPAGCKYIRVTVVGGGGKGGNGGSTNPAGGGGGGGGTVISWLNVSSVSSYSLSVGAGSSTTSPGGNSTFGTSLITANGGGVGGNSTSSRSGNGGTGGSGTIASPATSSNSVIINGGDGGAGWTNLYPGHGGCSSLSGIQGTNANGKLYGGGGSGGDQVGTAGNNGAQGIIIVEEFY